MANEAVIIELLGNGGDPVRYTCGDAGAITKGALLWLEDPRTVSGANVLEASLKPFAGIAAHDKVASDGSTSIACYTHGIFDITTVEDPTTISAGAKVVISGQNIVKISPDLTTASGAFIVGTALETAGAGEVIAVKIRI